MMFGYKTRKQIRSLTIQVWLLAERMEKVISDQDTLNQFVTDLTAAVTAVGAEIADLKAQIAAVVPPVAVDFTAADAALAALVALEPPAPVVTPPVTP